MAQQNLSPQDPQRSTSSHDAAGQPTAVPEAVGQSQERARQQSADLDGLLDEIDSVLETNAEDFVKGFVQKGGQ